MESKKPSPSTIDDRCPEWAEESIAQLLQVEIYLGNIPATGSWDSRYLHKISHPTTHDSTRIFDEEKAELLFSRIVKALGAEKFTEQEICDFFNRRLRYDRSPPYCSVDEVKQASR